MTPLKHRWLEVLAAAAAAVDSAGRARLIANESRRAHSRRVATERTWLETVDWRALPDARGTVAVLEGASASARLELGGRAA
jgi:hypothetical protein